MPLDGGTPITKPTLQPVSQDGITVAKDGDLHAAVTSAPKIVIDKTIGITLTPAGDIYANVSDPTSVLVNIHAASGDLIVRVNAGPGEILEYANASNNTMLGSIYEPTVFRSTDNNTIVGNTYSLSLAVIPNDYELPSNTIFRHVRASDGTAPTQATYGNFASLGNPADPPSLIYNTLSFPDENSYNLTFGGNVLDVYGTKYGEGDVLKLNLAPNPSAANTITMGGNTLAGFGTAYGDLQTLDVSAFTNSHSSSFSTTLTFKGNILWVDKNIDSTLYSHLENLDLSNHLTENSNLNIVFEDSILHGNLGADTFYGEIKNLGDLANPSKYNGFITGVKVVTPEVGGHVTIMPAYVYVEATTTRDDEGNFVTVPAHLEPADSTNSITWGNDVYSGGSDPDHPSAQNINTYHFTLLGTADPLPLPVMQGHDLITDFDLAKDTLIFQLTPALFKALDLDHDKVIDADDLNSGVIRQEGLDGTYFNRNGHFYNPLVYDTVFGSVITFKGGGSLSLQGVVPADFNDIHVETEVNLTYIPVAKLTLDEVVPSTPHLTEPFIYGQGPTANVHSYYNELDNFFANSLFAHYTIKQILPDGTTTETLPNGVEINQYGTITVNSLVPYIVPVTITATTVNPTNQQIDSDESGPLLFGFLKAPITTYQPDTPQDPDNPLQLLAPSEGPNILIGGLDSVIVGGTVADYKLTVQGAIDTTTPPADGTTPPPKYSFGSNLIVNTTNSTTAEAYGNFKTIHLTAQGKDNVITSTSLVDAQSVEGSINKDTFEFKPNAFYVNGTVFGVATSLQIDALGGNNAVINLTNPLVNVNNTANFDSNTFNIGSQVIYGDGAGVFETIVDGQPVFVPSVLTGIFNQIILNATPGTPKSESVPATAQTPAIDIKGGFNILSVPDINTVTGSIDTSSSIRHNTFNFGPTQITIQGDSSSQISTINANVHDLIITAKNIFLRDIGNLTNTTLARFADNHFNFSDATLTGDNGGVNFYGHLYNFGDAFDYDHYRGFVNGVTVSNENSHIKITTERNNNSITWGNNTYTGGDGADTYYFSIVKDVNNFAVMQGVDTITNFNPEEDTIVFNIERNLFNHLGMDDLDSQSALYYTLLASKLDNINVDVSFHNNSGTIISFTGPINSQVSFGSLTVDGIGLWSSLSQINSYYSYYLGINPIQIISTGLDYKPPTINPDALSKFDPVFVQGDQAQAFASFVTNTELESLTWGLANGIELPPEFSFTEDGTLHVFETSDGKTPVDAYIQVTVHDEENSGNIIITPDRIHIFALNADSGAAFRDASAKGSTATAIYETEGATKIVGGRSEGGDDLVYKDTTNPTAPGTELVYGSKLIYDISEGGHTAIGDVENLQFINTATTITTPATTTGTTPAITTHAISNLDGQTITFKANMFNINSGGVGAIFGNVKNLVLSGNASNDGQGALIDSTIAHNKFNFNPVTIYTVGSATLAALGNSFAAYGILQTLSLLIHNPESTVTGTIGNASITGNIFNFSANKLEGSSDDMTLNPGIGVLNIVNTDTATHDPSTPNPMPISGNILTFANSVLKGGTGHTIFNADIADLSNTGFVTSTVTLPPPPPGQTSSPPDQTLPVQVIDGWGNTITWGNNTYTILPDSQSSTLAFTLLYLGGNDGNDAAMQGHATINGFRPDTDTLNLKLAPLLFKALNTDFDRTVSTTELDNSQFTTFSYDSTEGGSTTLSFAPSLAAGSIKFMGQHLTSYYNFDHLIQELAYTPAPITVHNPALGLTPQIFLTSGGNGAGVYGNVLDSYFDHIDIGDEGSTYSVTLAEAYPQLINPSTLLSTVGSGTLFDQYGTARVGNVPTSPTLGILNIAPNDVNDPTNDVNVDLVIGTFNGTMTVDPNTAAEGTFTGSLSGPSYLQGNFANEILIGNADQIVVSAINQDKSFDGTLYGLSRFGGNMIINTNTGNTAYGVAKDILFSVDATSTQTEFMSDLYNFGSNAIYTNGAVFGVADKFLIEAKNSVNASFGSSAGPFSATFGNSLTPSTYSMGIQTIFGQGTLIGDVNAFQINVFGNTGASIVGTGDAYIDVSTSVKNNYFLFAPTQITVLGDDHSTIFSHINSLSFYTQQGATFIPQFGANQTLDNSASIMNNQFIFQDSIAVGGSGGIDYYSDINDLSSTSFWSSDSVSFSNNGTHISTKDSTNSSDPVSNNTITWGNNTVHLSTESGSPDTIHLNVLQDQNGNLGIPGNLDVYNFNATKDTLHFNMSIPMYKSLNGGSTTLNGLITAATLDSYVDVFSGINTVILFDYGSLALYGVSGHDTLASFPNIQVGTTLAGNRGVSDIFTVGIPTTFSDFKEVDHITQFNPTQDILGFALSPTAYAQASQYGWISGTDVLNSIEANAGTSTGGITITQKPMEYESVDPTNTGATVDTILNFGANNATSGSITLHNVNMTTLNSPFVQLGQQGTDASDTFHFIVPGSDFSTFTGNTFITGLASDDYIEIALPKALYDTITQNGTLSTADALSANVTNSTGGIIATQSGANTTLGFVTNNIVNGTIMLEGINSTLASLGSHLHLGYIDSATTGIDTFSFDLPSVVGSFATFNQFAHITNFDPNQDFVQITVPVGLYNSINIEGSLSGAALYASLAASAVDAFRGGITTTSEAAHYSSPQYGTGSNDLVLNFQVSGALTSGTITLHNVDPSTSLTSLENHFRFGSFQEGTTDIDTFAFNTPADGASNFSAFQQFDRIADFDLNQDFLNITLSVDLFNAISNNGKLSSEEIALGLKNNTHPNRGDINVVSANGSTSLEFVSNPDDVYPYGSITLEGVALAPGSDLDSFGSHLRFGSVQQGTSSTDTFTYNNAVHDNLENLSAFKEFAHIIDFNTGQDTLEIKISSALYDKINLANIFQGGSTSSADLAQALATGSANGVSLDTQITVAHTTAQYGTGVDSILQFMTSNGGSSVMTGSITMHNVNINQITDLNAHLQIVH